VALAVVDYEDRAPDVALAPSSPERAANLSFFFATGSDVLAGSIARLHCDWRGRTGRRSASGCRGLVVGIPSEYFSHALGNNLRFVGLSALPTLSKSGPAPSFFGFSSGATS
jgi:hypothetical protein